MNGEKPTWPNESRWKPLRCAHVIKPPGPTSTGLLIGCAYRRPMPQPSADAERIQAALLAKLRARASDGWAFWLIFAACVLVFALFSGCTAPATPAAADTAADLRDAQCKLAPGARNSNTPRRWRCWRQGSTNELHQISHFRRICRGRNGPPDGEIDHQKLSNGITASSRAAFNRKGNTSWDSSHQTTAAATSSAFASRRPYRTPLQPD